MLATPRVSMSPVPRMPSAVVGSSDSMTVDAAERSCSPLSSSTGLKTSDTSEVADQSTVAFTATRALPGPATASTMARTSPAMFASSSRVRSRSSAGAPLVAPGAVSTVPSWSVMVTCSRVSPSTAPETSDAIAVTCELVSRLLVFNMTEAEAWMLSLTNRSCSGITRFTRASSTDAISSSEFSISDARPRW